MFSARLLAIFVVSVGLWQLPTQAVPTLGMSQQLLLAQLRPATKSITPKAAIERVLTADEIESSWFAPAFLERVSIDKLQQIHDQFKPILGAYKGLQEDGQGYLAIFERATVPIKVHLDASGRIDNLVCQRPRF